MNNNRHILICLAIVAFILSAAQFASASCDLQITSAGPCLADSTDGIPHVGDAYGLKITVNVNGNSSQPFRIKWKIANGTYYFNNITVGTGTGWWWYFVWWVDLDDSIPWSVTLDPDGVSGNTNLIGSTASGSFTPVPPATAVELYSPRLMHGFETYTLAFQPGSGTIADLNVVFGVPTTHGAQSVISVSPPTNSNYIVTQPYGIPVYEIARTNVAAGTFSDTNSFVVQLSRIRVNPTILRTKTWADMAALTSDWTQWIAPDQVCESTDSLIVSFVQQSLPANYRTILTPYDTARTLHRAVMKKLTYHSPPTHGDAVNVLQDGIADCGGFSALLTACLRNVGIPARQISGFWQGETNWHVRVEFHLPGVEWVVADPTAGNGDDPTGTYAYNFGYTPNSDSYLAVDVGDAHVRPYYDFLSIQPPNFWWTGEGTFNSYTPMSYLEPYPPRPVTSPSPADGSTGQSNSTTLAWAADSDATSYDVYFGASNPPAAQTNQDETSYSPGSLNSGTMYYWRIDAKNDGGTTTGTVWSFTTRTIPPPMRLITVQANPPAGGSVSGTGSYAVGTTIQISATANPGWTFAGWSDGVTSASRTLTVPATSTTYTANFVQQLVMVTVVALPSAGATILSGGGTYSAGTSETLFANANSGWTFVGWSDGGAQMHTIIVPATNITYAAIFTQNPIPTATIIVKADPASGGIVSSGGTYPVGTNVQITATANNGWTFTGWSDGGGQAHTITVPATNITYTATFVQPTVATPTITPIVGMFTNSVTVTMTCATTGAMVYYTIDGAIPTANSLIYSSPLTLTNSATVKAVAFKTGYNASTVASASFVQFISTVATPTIWPVTGTFTNSVTVAVTCATAGTTIYYTTDGSVPTTDSSVYSGPFAVTGTGTVKVKAVVAGYTDSAVASASFTIVNMPAVATPSITPASSTAADSVAVTLRCAMKGAKIYYTTNGVTPTASSTLYKKAITLTASATVKAIAVKTGLTQSTVASATYTITHPTITTASVAGGTVGTAYGPVTLQADTGGATPYKWSWTANRGSKLPPGLKLSSAGVITGKPTKAGSYSVTVKLTDAKKKTITQALLLTLEN